MMRVMSGNFSFLSDMFPALEKLGTLAENYLHSDPNSCLIKLGILAETIVNYMFELDGMPPLPIEKDTHANRINALTREIDDILYLLRKKRNDAVHKGYDSFNDSKTLLNMTYTLSVWFMQVYGEHTYEPGPFVLPDDNRTQFNYNELIEENEKLSRKLE
jgi:type I restriction enzyme R subunit